MQEKEQRPIKPVHPSELIREEMNTRGLYIADLAFHMRMDIEEVEPVLNGQKAIDPDTAKAIASVFHWDYLYLMKMQKQYWQDCARREYERRTSR